MKTIQQLLALTGLATMLFAPGGQPAFAAVSNQPEAAPTDPALGTVRLKFRNAPLELVLDYLSEAAGFTIFLEAQPKGTVDVWSERSLSPEEAFNLINSVLIKNGYAAIRNGRTLTIVNRDEAKTRSIPVRLGGDPAAIPGTAEIVTQIIPVRFTEVSQLIKDLQPLLSTRATLTANESANAIVITDTQANIHRMANLIQAIDAGAEDLTLVKVFRLQNADPSETADLLAELFPTQSQSQTSQTSVPFGGGPGMPGGFEGGPPGLGGLGDSNPGASTSSTGQNRQSQRLKKRANVTAVADARTASLVVSASRDVMPQVERIVTQLDANPAGKQKVGVYHLKSAQAQQVAKVLQDLFQKNGAATSRTAATTQTDPLETRRTTQSQSQQTSSSSRQGLGGGSGGLGGGGAGGGGLGLQ